MSPHQMDKKHFSEKLARDKATSEQIRLKMLRFEEDRLLESISSQKMALAASGIDPVTGGPTILFGTPSSLYAYNGVSGNIMFAAYNPAKNVFSYVDSELPYSEYGILFIQPTHEGGYVVNLLNTLSQSVFLFFDYDGTLLGKSQPANSIFFTEGEFSHMAVMEDNSIHCLFGRRYIRYNMSDLGITDYTQIASISAFRGGFFVTKTETGNAIVRGNGVTNFDIGGQFSASNMSKFYSNFVINAGDAFCICGPFGPLITLNTTEYQFTSITSVSWIGDTGSMVLYVAGAQYGAIYYFAQKNQVFSTEFSDLFVTDFAQRNRDYTAVATTEGSAMIQTQDLSWIVPVFNGDKQLRDKIEIPRGLGSSVFCRNKNIIAGVHQDGAIAILKTGEVIRNSFSVDFGSISYAYSSKGMIVYTPANGLFSIESSGASEPIIFESGTSCININTAGSVTTATFIKPDNSVVWYYKNDTVDNFTELQIDVQSIAVTPDVFGGNENNTPSSIIIIASNSDENIPCVFITESNVYRFIIVPPEGMTSATANSIIVTETGFMIYYTATNGVDSQHIAEIYDNKANRLYSLDTGGKVPMFKNTRVVINDFFGTTETKAFSTVKKDGATFNILNAGGLAGNALEICINDRYLFD